MGTCFKGAPRFFRACIGNTRECGRPRYSLAGHELARHTEMFVEGCGADEYWLDLELLQGLAADRDELGIARWYDRHFPACMALISQWGRRPFARGVIEAFDGGLL